MSSRSLISTLAPSFSPSPLRLATKWMGAAMAFGLLAASATGCGGTASVVCDADGCMICDGYGCRPADDDGLGLGGSGGSGGSTSTSTGDSGGAGGSAPCDPEQATCPCDEQGMCPEGKACVVGLCIEGCNFSYECGPGKLCFDGACVPGCSDDMPCDAGYACQSGGCVLDPTAPACDDAHPCPSGEICNAGVCTTGCAVNSDCKSDEVCDGGSHACIPDPSPKPLCDAEKQCKAPQVCKEDGYCHYPCAALSECKLIDNRFVACDAGVCKTEQEVAPECTLADPCPDGQSCVSNTCL